MAAVIRSIRVFALIFCLSAVSACRVANPFRDAARSAPHALLTTAPWTNTGNINGASVFWHLRSTYRLAPGSVSLGPSYSDRKLTYWCGPMRFDAVAGRVYRLTPGRPGSTNSLADIKTIRDPTFPTRWKVEDPAFSLVLEDITDPSKPRELQRNIRTDYIFGAENRREALEEYLREHRGNPPAHKPARARR